MARFNLRYRWSIDEGETWYDLTPAVDSLQTRITYNLCTNNFTSAKDQASITLPPTTSLEKDAFIGDLLSSNNILMEIYGPKAGLDVVWDENDVVWANDDVRWGSYGILFTGYVDRSTLNLKSYPLPTALTVNVFDISILHLDNKVDRDIILENMTVTGIVRTLLGYSGMSYDSTSVNEEEDVTLEAFVIDKDNAQTYREYIDLLLFEIGGYVLDIKNDGIASIVRLPWDRMGQPTRIIDNPMTDNGISIRATWLLNDGVKLKWSTLKWTDPDQLLWVDSISRKINEHGYLTGVTIPSHRYWPDGGEITPSYFQYVDEKLDEPYMTRESRKRNEDLSIIMAKNVYADIRATKGYSKFDGFTYPIPADFQTDPYNFTSNPMIWPKKAWYLLYNPTDDDVDLQFFDLHGTALYRAQINTLTTEGGTNPKEYESTYIFDKDQASRFLKFYWSFLQSSRFSMTWREPNVEQELGEAVRIKQKGMTYSQDAVIVSKTQSFLNKDVEIWEFSAVGISEPVLREGVPTTTVPSGAKESVRGASTIVAQLSSPASYTLAQWETYGTVGQPSSWNVSNIADYRQGDIAVINGTISNLDDTPVTLYATVITVGTSSINVVGQYIRYAVAEMWDFSLSQTSYVTNQRYADQYNTIVAQANVEGHAGVSITWTVRDANNALIQTGTGESITISIPMVNAYASPISVSMSSTGLPTITKKLTSIDQTEKDHDFGAWQPTTIEGQTYIVPESFTDAMGMECEVIEGDFLVAAINFSTMGTAVSPSGSENPSELGWYEQNGSGTTADPYWYSMTSDTTVTSGKTYYTPGGDVYLKGVPYIYEEDSWHNEMEATLPNTKRMLQCLGNVLNNPNAQPESNVTALYGWFKNLVALNAIIYNLVAQNLNVGTYGTGFSFRALTDDGNGNKVFDVSYGNNSLFHVDIQSGEIFFGSGFRYDPNYDSGAGAIRSNDDGVIILSNGNIDIKRGSYRSNLVCPSFRSEPRGSIINPTTVSISGNRQQQANAMYNQFPNAFLARPCTHSGDSSVKYVSCTVNGSGSSATYQYVFYNVNMAYVGQIQYNISYSQCMSTWENTSFILTVGTTTNITFRLVTDSDTPTLSIGTDPSNLLTGELYYSADGSGTGTLHVKL